MQAELADFVAVDTNEIRAKKRAERNEFRGHKKMTKRETEKN